MIEMDDDEEVPELVTLDDHLSDEVERRLSGSLSGYPDSEDTTSLIAAEGDKTKVPITILTGLCLS